MSFRIRLRSFSEEFEDDYGQVSLISLNQIGQQFIIEFLGIDKTGWLIKKYKSSDPFRMEFEIFDDIVQFNVRVKKLTMTHRPDSINTVCVLTILRPKRRRRVV